MRQRIAGLREKLNVRDRPLDQLRVVYYVRMLRTLIAKILMHNF